MQQSQHSWNERMVVAQTSNHIGVYRNFMLMETSNGKIFIDIPRIKWWSGKEWPEGLLWTCTEMWQKPWPNPKCQNDQTQKNKLAKTSKCSCQICRGTIYTGWSWWNACLSLQWVRSGGDNAIIPPRRSQHTTLARFQQQRLPHLPWIVHGDSQHHHVSH